MFLADSCPRSEASRANIRFKNIKFSADIYQPIVPRQNHSIVLKVGVFHSTKNFGMNFRKLPLTNGAAFSGISVQRTTLRDIPKFSEISYRKLPFHLTLLPVFPEFSIEWFA